MAVIHKGDETPILPEIMNPNDMERIYTSWTNKLNGATITSSTWIIPSNFTQVSAIENGSVTDSRTNTTYTDVNGILLSTTEKKGIYLISNRVTMSDGRTITKSFYLPIDSSV